MKAQVINSLGKKVKKIELNDEVFAAEYNEPLIHQAIVAQLANARQAFALRNGRTAAWYSLRSPETFPRS